MIIFINLLLLLILPPFIEQFQSLLNIFPKVNEKINDLIDWINNLLKFIFPLMVEFIYICNHMNL